MNKRFNPVKPVKAEEIITLSGVSAVIDHFAYVLANPGEGFLIGKPLYGGFINDLTARAEYDDNLDLLLKSKLSEFIE